ncbi:MAG: carbohydrate-binding family V/XII, partial [Thermoanaerobaculia bacterium]|nr:carbohydrate-binding family V/XII [Thermoanaerobaculia bacterium]
VTWPEATDAEKARFTEIVEGAVPASGFEISHERLVASLETAEREQRSLDLIKNEAPVIVFREQLAVLLLYDGEPLFVRLEDERYERALNTAFAVARERRSGTVYLSSGALWYRADDPLGPFTPLAAPPADLAALIPAGDDDVAVPDPPPEIVVATEPTELVASDGAPLWQSLPGGELLYVENTETPWLRELASNQMYLLISGRWFRSASAAGPWEFVRADSLPDAFDDIPPDSDLGGLRTSVAGTEEAQEAMLEAQVPRMAAIRRDEAKLEVEYDGKPNFEPIPGTEVAYATNTGAQVLEIDGTYYAVDNGVWFRSASATGPWEVADEIPEDKIAEIPPSSPVYNTTHVHVYESTPEVVYVGYTPGYLWSFPYYGVPIYGTGWYYPPYWRGPIYYPRHPTWGFHVGYNPWTGWNFGLSWSNGFFSFGISWGGGWSGGYRPWGCCGGWYGGGYRGPTFINTGDINIGNNVNVGNRVEARDRVAAAGGAGTAAELRASGSLYNRPENRSRNADRATARSNLAMARPATGRANDVFADRDGKVARSGAGGWETREAGAWRPAPEGDRSQAAARPETRPERPAPSTRPSRPQSLDYGDLDRHRTARSRGASREMSRSRPSRGGGGFRRR